MRKIKDHLGFVIFFAAVITVFLWKLIIMRGGFIDGDYLAQFYPWSKIYSEALKDLGFPFWTRCFQSGFPLMAEGQVGGFYPLNMAFFFALPFHAAYNYIVVLHFVMAGVFTYLYTRKLGACQWGGALAALLFCFGSAYAGCFYNTVTVKTLVWFPLALFLFERYFERRKAAYVLAAGLVLGNQLLAGFTQVAVYSALFYAVYFFSGLLSRKDLRVKDVVYFVSGLVIAGMIFLPQLMLSWPLVNLSGRADASLAFALWGSFPPLNLMGLVFPYWVFTGARLYIGVFSLLFLMAAITRIKHDRRLWPVIAVLLASFLLALGKYNPLYVLFLKITGLFSFRNPSKFLFFGMFASSVLAGCGFTGFFTQGIPEKRTGVLRAFSVFISAMLALFFLAKAALTLFGEKILKLGEWYVTNYIHGREFHRYDLETYLGKVKGFYESFVRMSSVTNPYILFSLILCVVALLVARYFIGGGRLRPVYKGFFIAVIFAIACLSP